MPDVDGYQVVDYIDRRSLDTPVIFITGHASVDSPVEVVRGGTYDCLRKPLDYEELLKTVADAVDQKRHKDQDNQVSKLLKGNEKLEAAQRVKEELLSRMSHTMRIPLNGVVGLAKLLLDTELTSEQYDCGEMLLGTAESLRDMINGDLELFQADGVEMIEFDLLATMEALYDLLAERASKKGFQLDWIIHPKVPSRLWGDPRRLRQILVNLSDNAIKFTEKGKIVIRVFLDEETDTHVTLRFAITDTDIGVPADRTDGLFNPPFGSDVPRRWRSRWTGIEFAISERLAQMMGGQIGVNSHEGRGSTFWFTAVFEKEKESMESHRQLPGALRRIGVQ
jgi:signal transduction histidine kinase